MTERAWPTRLLLCAGLVAAVLAGFCAAVSLFGTVVPGRYGAMAVLTTQFAAVGLACLALAWRRSPPPARQLAQIGAASMVLSVAAAATAAWLF